MRKSSKPIDEALTVDIIQSMSSAACDAAGSQSATPEFVPASLAVYVTAVCKILRPKATNDEVDDLYSRLKQVAESWAKEPRTKGKA